MADRPRDRTQESHDLTVKIILAARKSYLKNPIVAPAVAPPAWGLSPWGYLLEFFKRRGPVNVLRPQRVRRRAAMPLVKQKGPTSDELNSVSPS